MNKKILWIAFGIVILLGIGYFVYSQNKTGQQEVDTSQLSGQTVPQDSEAPQENTNTSSRYVVYSKESLENSADTKRVLFFYASWCPYCRPADADFLKNTNLIPEDVTVIRVNYNDPDTNAEEKELAKKYRITYQHTFVQIDQEGNEVTKWVGGQIPELLRNIQ